MITNSANNCNNISFGMLGFLKTKTSKPDKTVTLPKGFNGFGLETLGQFNQANLFADSRVNASARSIENKMFDQTFAYNKYAVDSMIKKVSNDINLPYELTQEALARLCQFASYRELDSLSEQMQEFNIGNPCILNREKLSINNVLDYLGNRKGQFEFASDKNSQALFVDNMLLNELEKEENLGLVEKIKKNNIPIALVDGWCVDFEGEDISQSLFGSRMNFESSLTKLAKKMKEEDLTLDEALNGQAIKRIENLFGKETEIKIIKNKNLLENITNENITDSIQPNLPDKKEIKAVIETLSELNLRQYGFNNIEIEHAKNLLGDYFNSMLVCYSAQTITANLKQKYEQIKEFARQNGKTEDDIYYVIPTEQKSFDLITYQYLKSNDISLDKVIHYGKTKDENFNIKDYDGKIFVLLDDIVGSATSVLVDNFNYFDFSEECYDNKADINLIFAPLTALKSGVRNIENEMRCNRRSDKDKIMVNNIIDYSKFEEGLIEQDRQILSKILGGIGYSAGRACTSMPYMIPDNCTLASGLLLRKVLNKNTESANKAAGKRHQEYRMIDEKVKNGN